SIDDYECGISAILNMSAGWPRRRAVFPLYSRGTDGSRTALCGLLGGFPACLECQTADRVGGGWGGRCCSSINYLLAIRVAGPNQGLGDSLPPQSAAIDRPHFWHIRHHLIT